MAYIGVSPSNGVRQKHTYTATASQTTFSGAGAEGISLSYRDSNYVDVYVNGVKLGDADYTATSGTSIVFDPGLPVNDIVEVIVYDVFSVADTVSKADGGTFDGNVTMAGTLAVTGETTLSANLNLGDNDRVIFGAGDDLQIYHDTSVNHSYISESGSGDLIIEGGNIRLENGSSQYYIRTYNNAQVELFYNNSEKLATTNTGIDVTGVITTDGMTTSADINFGDNDKAVFGAGSDLQIYHDGSNSYISDQGDGNLLIQAATNTQIKSADGTLLSAKFRPDLAADLYYNNQLKFSTTNTGIDVTGTATMDGLTVNKDSGTDHIEVTNGTAGTDASPQFMDLTFTGFSNRDKARVRGVDRNSSRQGGSLQFETSDANSTDGSTYKTRLFIDTDGDISFYEDTGTTPKLFWDASEERLGIGTSSPSEALHLVGNMIITPRDQGIKFNNEFVSVFRDVDSLKLSAYSGITFFDTNASTERMRIDSSGNVGIGITPVNHNITATTLHVDGGSNPSELRLTNTTTGTATSNGFHIAQIGNEVYLVQNENSNMRFYTNGTEAMRIDSSGNVGIGTNSNFTDAKLHVYGVNGGGDVSLRIHNATTTNNTTSSLKFTNTTSDYAHGTITAGRTPSPYLSFSTSDNTERMRIDSSGNVGIGTSSPAAKLDLKHNSASTHLRLTENTSGNWSAFGVDTSDNLRIYANNAERMRIDSSGQVLINKTSTNSSVTGVYLADGQSHFSRSGGQVVLVNRQSGDGTIVGFASADSTEGNISISGSTTSYNAFSASHWSRLTDNSKPTILKGTVIETIDEMMDWYQLTFTVPATDDTPEHSPKISIALEDGQSVGDTITYNYDGIDYQATIIQEADNKHTKCKISDTADSTRVYGVFADWDNDDDTVNDMYVTAVGTHVVRVHSSATISAGDLLVSNGDGTAKVQDDDIIRSKTIGKVLTNIVQETYDDGSYTVPCALYCG